MKAREILNTLIKEKGIKKKYIANQLGISENSFSQKMHGRSSINIDELIDILLCIGVDPPEFMKIVLLERKKD